MCEEERYAIIDATGIIFEGSELEELEEIFNEESHDFDFTGDLLLVKILARTR